MVRFRWAIRLALVVVLATVFERGAYAQTQIRKGVLLLYQVRALSAQGSTLSSGRLTDLQTDSNFDGDYQSILNTASTILNGYTIVRNGGYFPENRGIPRNRQLSVSEVVYYLYSLSNGNELFLYRSPTENTAEYFIRKK